jgi:TonB family protein
MQEYLEEKLPATGMHRVERHLLDCDLCSDALEGLSALPQKHNLSDSITHLKHKIRKKSLRDPIVRRKRKIVPLLWKPVSVAAAIIILLSGTFLLLRINKHSQHSSKEISLAAPKQADKVIPQGSATQEGAALNSTELKEEESSIAMSEIPEQRSAKSTAAKRSLLQQNIPAVETEETLPDEVTDTEFLSIPPVAAAPEPENKEVNTQAVPLISPSKATVDNTVGAPSRGVNTRAASGISQSFVTISGKVVSAEDEMPLAGVNVVIKGTSKGIATDSQGNFSLQAPVDGILVFNFIGMQTEEIPVKNQNKIDVSLQSDMQALNEVVVSGYGKKKEKASNYSYKKPEPINGYVDFKKYIKYQLRYPDAAKINGIEGTVRIEFEVQPNGQLSNFAIKKSLGYGCDEEAIRLIKEGPHWKAAQLNGEPVKRKFNVSIPFKLQD